LLQTTGIFNGSGRIVDGAGADNNEETVITLLNYFDGLVATRADSSNGFTGLFIVVSYVLGVFFFYRVLASFPLCIFFVSGRRALAMGNDSLPGSRTEGTGGRAKGRSPGLKRHC
jgi:hypothetical protein